VDELRRQSLPVEEIAVVGGGAASPFVLDRIAHHAAARVVPGATEASALGNALLQGVALGRFRDLADARAWAEGDGP
jgi:sugar (pentulose or hexulose) kinase